MECIFRRRRKEARPGELLSAALEVFAEKGFAATRLDDVAARAGVSKGTVYLYFKNKEALFRAAIETALLPAMESVEALAAETDCPAPELLRRFMDSAWRVMGSPSLGNVPKLLVAEAGNFPEIVQWFDETFGRRAQTALAKLIDIGVARGEFRQVDSDIAARTFIATLFSYLIWQRAFAGITCDDLPPPERFFDEAVRILVYGLVPTNADKQAQP
jgi:AcrR family transcriptional regulator